MAIYSRPRFQNVQKRTDAGWTKFQRLVALSALILFFLLSGVLAAARPAEHVVIGLGESVRVTVPRSSRVHVSDGGIVRARAIGATILLTGKRTGRTTLRFLSTESQKPVEGDDRTIFVTERKTAETARRFDETLLSRRGLRFDFTALPRIVVVGELLRLQDWLDLVEIAKSTRVAWRMEAAPLRALEDRFRSHIERELTRLAWPGYFLHLRGGGPRLVMGADGPELKPHQTLAMTAMGIALETSPTLTDLEPMVRTQIVLAEVRRSRVQRLGIRWPTGVGVGLTPGITVPTETLMASIEALEATGDGRILAMPNLLCRSGGEAKFLAGGELPIKISTTQTSQVEWKRYGIMLHVQPKADRLRRMKFQLSTEISSIDTANSSDGVPGVLTNRIETQFNLNGSQTIVLSGLIKREDGKKIEGVALLSKLPILGKLFSSEAFQQYLTELIVFVTPEVFFQDGRELRGDSNE